jgi:hypothetical protein
MLVSECHCIALSKGFIATWGTMLGEYRAEKRRGSLTSLVVSFSQILYRHLEL